MHNLLEYSSLNYDFDVLVVNV